MAKQAKKQPKTAAEAPIPFEQAIAELEAIVKDMESERMPLDQLVERYERGNRLLKTCQTRIQEAEQRIEMIATGKNQKTLQPFDADKAADAVKEEPKPAKTPPKQEPAKPEEPKEPKEPDSAEDEISLF